MTTPYGYNPYNDAELSELEKQQEALRMGVAPPVTPVAADRWAAAQPSTARPSDPNEGVIPEIGVSARWGNKSIAWLRSHKDSPEYQAFRDSNNSHGDFDSWDDAAWARAQREETAERSQMGGKSGSSQDRPLDLSPSPSQPHRGMATSSVTTEGLRSGDMSQLEQAYAQMTGRRIEQAGQQRETERGVQSRHLGDANARGIEAANQEVAAQKAIDESRRKQEALQKEQDDWSQRKDDPSQAFAGDNWAVALAAIGMASGTFSQLMGWQGTNPVKDTFDKTIDREIASQREQKNSRLKVLEARLGDEKAAELQRRGELHEATASRIAAQMQGTQAQDALARLNDVYQDQVTKAQEYQLAAHKELLPKQSVTESPLKPKGAVDPVERAKKAAEAAKALEAAGASKEDIAKMFQSVGISAPSEKTAAEYERDEKAAKAGAPTPEEKKDLRDRVDGLAETIQGFKELDDSVGFKRDAKGEVVSADEKKLDAAIPGAVTQMAQASANLVPFGGSKGAGELAGKLRDEDVKKLERIRDKIVFGQAKAEGQGALSEGDREVYRARIAADSPLSLQRSTAEQWRQRKQQYDNLVGKYGKEKTDAEFRSRGIDPVKEFGAGG